MWGFSLPFIIVRKEAKWKFILACVWGEKKTDGGTMYITLNKPHLHWHFVKEYIFKKRKIIEWVKSNIRQVNSNSNYTFRIGYKISFSEKVQSLLQVAWCKSHELLCCQEAHVKLQLCPYTRVTKMHQHNPKRCLNWTSFALVGKKPLHQALQVSLGAPNEDFPTPGPASSRLFVQSGVTTPANCPVCGNCIPRY